ncbi:MAG: citryl-CoA lyase [Candidatus Magasanikbacteria bacterium]|nr:citryl-CoA lyase [Candidatus Magasanikbacteria bacterium]
MKIKTAITNFKQDKEFIRGQDLEELIKNKSFVESIFLILKGELPSDNETKMMNALFTAAIDHGPGTASAQTARITVSAKNSMHTSLAAGILAMGDRHGSAIEGAAKFFQENFDCDDVESLVKDLKEKKIRIPGYGHPFLEYDNRVDVLFEVAKETGFYGKHSELAEKVRDVLNSVSSKKLPLNVDGVMGAIISDMGFDWKLGKGFFIIARVPGLVAHIYEEIVDDVGVRRMDQGDIEYKGK